jgi:hypothetical protein
MFYLNINCAMAIGDFETQIAYKCLFKYICKMINFMFLLVFNYLFRWDINTRSRVTPSQSELIFMLYTSKKELAATTDQ